MITKQQQEILDSLESEESRAHYRAQFEMANELGDRVPAGGIFDAPVAGYSARLDNDRMVQRAELVTGRAEPEDLLGTDLDRKLDDAELAAGLSPSPREDLKRGSGMTQELKRPPPDDPLAAPVPSEIDREYNVVIVGIVVLVVLLIALGWWLST